MTKAKRRLMVLDKLAGNYKVFLVLLALTIMLRPCLAQEAEEKKLAQIKAALRERIKADLKAKKEGAGAEATGREIEKLVRSEEEELVSLNFEGADIGVVLKVYSELKKVTVIKGERVAGKVTVISPIKLPKEEAVRVIEAVLEMKGLTIVKDPYTPGIVKVLSQKEAVQKAIETRVGGEVVRPEDIMVTQIIPLKFVEAETIIKDLRPLVSPNGTIFSSERTNIVVMIDTASNIKRLLDIITELDVEVFRGKLQIKVIQLIHAEVEELAEILNKIFAPEAARGRVPTRRVIRRRAERVAEAAIPKEALEELMGKVKVIPYERLQSLVLITTVEYFQIVYDLIKKLDVEGPAAEEATRVYYLQNAKAKEMVDVLKSLFTGITEEKERPVRRRRVAEEEKETRRAGLVGEINLVADERTNALLITTDPQNFPTIESLIEKLDIRSPQVLIEVLIAEVTLNDETKFGIEWEALTRAYDPSSKLEADWGLVSDFSERTAASSAATGFRYWLLRNDQTLNAFLWAIASESQVNILSAPRILTSNNQEAKIVIGEEVPVVKESRVYYEQTGTPSYKTFEYKDVAIELTVTPRISQEKDVALDIHQVVKKLGTYDEDLEAYSFVKREAQTSVVVSDKQTLIIGGLIKDDKKESMVKVPFLGDIPLLGHLFKKRTTIVEKTELMLFITPHVVLTAEEAETMTREQESKVKIEGTPLMEEAEEHYLQGVRYYKEGRYAEAITEWEKTIALDPGHKDVKRYMEEARAKLRKIKERGRIEQERKKEKLRIEKEKERLRTNGEKKRRDQARKHYSDGKAFHREGKYADAIREWEKVLSLDPNHRASIVGIQRAKKKLEEVRKEAQVRVQARKHFLLGKQHYEESDYYKAIYEWERAVLLDPDYEEARQALNKARRELKRSEKGQQ